MCVTRAWQLLGSPRPPLDQQRLQAPSEFYSLEEIFLKEVLLERAF